MRNFKATQLVILLGIVSAFAAGFCFACVDNKTVTLIFSLSPIGILCLCAILIQNIEKSIKRLHTEETSQLLSKTLTGITEDGSYTLDPADMYDAIEKLGYIEHEWRDSNGSIE